MNHKIGADSNKKNIVVHQGDTIEVELDETPVAGYSWDVDRIDNNIAKLESNNYKLYNNAGIGGGGLRTMVFLVDGKGSGKIKLKNSQRWSGDIYQQFEIDVNAQ